MPEYPLLPLPSFEQGDPPRSPRPVPNLSRVPAERQEQRLGPKFDRLQQVLASENDGLSLRNDPSSIAPERGLVLEVAGSVRDFYALVKRVDGLEFLADEEIEFEPDADFFVRDTRKGKEREPRTDKSVGGRLYLVMPDVGALRRLLSLWSNWQRGESLPRGQTRWRDIFSSLRDIRPWGLADRITDETAEFWSEKIEADPEGVHRIEAELWFHESAEHRQAAYQRLKDTVSDAGGTIVDHSVIEAIGYEAALIDLPASEVARLVAREEISLAICDDVMFLRPQSSVHVPEPDNQAQAGPRPPAEPPNGLPPIAAVLDGMPVQNHRLLEGRLDIDDADNLEPMSVLGERYHGTAMASLILHGDRNRHEASIQRKIHMRPVLYAPGNGLREQPRQDRLLVDVIYRAVRRLKEGDGNSSATAPQVFLVNLSLGDPKRPFSGSMSPLAKLLDYLADRYGILFLVSAGNVTQPLPLDEFPNWTSFEDAEPGERERASLQALFNHKAYRTLLSPAEALNIVTVGALHDDAFSGQRGVVADPYEDGALPNISSAQGLGHRKIVKPDIHLPGGREHVRFQASGETLSVVPGGRYGLSAASPDAAGNLDHVSLTPGTSAATALATRAAHRLFEALMDVAGGSMHTGMDPQFYAVVVKALLIHRATWGNRATFLNRFYGPQGRGKHVERLDNIARLLGYGFPNVEEVLSCAPNRATLVGYGTIEARATNIHRIPLPPSLEMVIEPRVVTVTVAWFSPVNPRHQAYRRAKLEVSAVTNLESAAGVNRSGSQPSDKSVPRGAVFHTRYEGSEAVQFVDDGHILLRVFCREQAGSLDQTIRYGVAVTIEADEGIPIYDEVRTRLALPVRASTR